MTRVLVLALCLTAGCVGAVAAQSVTAPASPVSLPAAPDYAVRVLQDRWDMNQRSDVGWFLYSADQPAPNIGSLSLNGGVLAGTSTATNPNIFLLETGTPVSVVTGKLGNVYPIDASRYQRLSFRLCLTGGGAQWSQLLWSRQTIFEDLSIPNALSLSPGCQIYSANLAALGMPALPAPYKQYPWSGLMRSLRMNLTNVANIPLSMDWATLTADTDASTWQTISWSGAPAGGVDIYLDSDNNPANGNLGLLSMQNGTQSLRASGVQGTSYTFPIGSLPPGDYWIAIKPTGLGSAFAYSTGSYHVESAPTITVLSPSEDGSSDDFATVQLGNPWDMRDAADIDHLGHITGGTPTTLTVERLDGTSLPAHNVFYGVSVAGSADPQLDLLWSAGRGKNVRIDTSRYRILSAEIGVAGARDMAHGSVARVIWKRSDETLSNVSQDIVVNHRAGVNSLDKIVVDLGDPTAFPLETDPGGSPSRSGWTGLVNGFRIDPHEFSDARPFWLGRVRLSSYEKAAHAYTVRWRLGDVTDPSVSVALYYDTDRSGFNGTQIVSNLSPATESDGTGAYTWNLDSVPNGTYYVYLRVTSATATLLNQAYARWPLVINHSYVAPPLVALDRQSLAYAAINNGKITTGAQDVAVSFTDGASAWSASSPDCNFVKFTGAAGAGNGSFSVFMEKRTTYPAGAHFVCTVRVDAPGAANTPQFLTVTFDILRSSAAPFGVVDTPVNNASVDGSVGVTGWALDDLQVASVSIYRDTVTGETPTSPNGKVYMADAAFLEGARPDIQTRYPASPWAYRAGWGCLVLTNMLPFQGNGPFMFYVYATDVEGKQTLLGTRRIVGTNSSAVTPFGAIDTPGLGQVVSGVIANFGWALTPQPNSIPADGSTIWVYIDSVPVGHPTYNQYRSDIATLFPGYANSNGAIGYFIIDTHTLSNGLHTIAWSVTDTGGNAQGIGSRFFRVRN